MDAAGLPDAVTGSVVTVGTRASARVDGTLPHRDYRRTRGNGGVNVVGAAVDRVVSDDAFCIPGDIDRVDRQPGSVACSKRARGIPAGDRVRYQHCVGAHGVCGGDQRIDHGHCQDARIRRLGNDHIQGA